MKIWHQRLCHISQSVIFQSKQYVRGLENIYTGNWNICTRCKIAKSTRKPLKLLKDTSSRCPLNKVYSDVVGLIEWKIVGSSKYYVALLDEYSTYSWVRFVERKSKVADSIIEMIKALKNVFDKKPQSIRLTQQKKLKWFCADGSGKFVENALRTWMTKCRILQEITTAYSLESDGKAERLNRTLLHMLRLAMLGARWNLPATL